MSIFTTILEKLGLRKETPAVSTPKPAPEAPKPSPKSATTAPPKPPTPLSVPPVSSSPTHAPPLTPVAHASAAPKPPETHTEAHPAAIPVVDVVAKLEGMAAKRPDKLNWKISIVDLLKLLEIDSSFKARQELAEELGCPANFMADSAKMNTWLHKTVLSKIAENGGNIPKELLD